MRLNYSKRLILRRSNLWYHFAHETEQGAFAPRVGLVVRSCSRVNVGPAWYIRAAGIFRPIDSTARFGPFAIACLAAALVFNNSGPRRVSSSGQHEVTHLAPIIASIASTSICPLLSDGTTSISSPRRFDCCNSARKFEAYSDPCVKMRSPLPRGRP